MWQECLHGCSEAPTSSCEGGTLVVLESPKLGDARSMGYLLRIQTRCETSPRDKYEVNKAANSLKSEERFAIRHEDAEFDGFRSCFGTVFPHYAPFPLFCNGNVYSVPLYTGSGFFFFLDLQGDS